MELEPTNVWNDMCCTALASSYKNRRKVKDIPVNMPVETFFFEDDRPDSECATHLSAFWWHDLGTGPAGLCGEGDWSKVESCEGEGKQINFNHRSPCLEP